MHCVLGRIGGGQGGGALPELISAEQNGIAVFAGGHQHVEVVGEVVDPAKGVHDEVVGGHESHVESRYQPHRMFPAKSFEKRVGICPDFRIDDRLSL